MQHSNDSVSSVTSKIKPSNSLYQEICSAEKKWLYVRQPLQLATITHDAYMMRLTWMLIDLSSGHLHAQITAPRCEQTESSLYDAVFVSRRTNESVSTSSNAVNRNNLVKRLQCRGAKYEQVGTSSNYCNDNPKCFRASIKLLIALCTCSAVIFTVGNCLKLCSWLYYYFLSSGKFKKLQEKMNWFYSNTSHLNVK